MNFRKPSPDRGLKVIADLRELGVKIAKPIEAAIESYNLVMSRKPIRPTDEEFAAAFVDPNSTAGDRERLAHLVASQSTAIKAWSTAHEQAGNAIQRALAADIDNISEALRPKAEEAIADITWYAAEGQPDLAALLRAGRPEDASRAAGVLTAWGKFDHITDVRSAALGKFRFQWTIWENPAHVDKISNMKIPAHLKGLDRIVKVITEGGILAWTTGESHSVVSIPAGFSSS